MLRVPYIPHQDWHNYRLYLDVPFVRQYWLSLKKKLPIQAESSQHTWKILGKKFMAATAIPPYWLVYRDPYIGLS